MKTLIPGENSKLSSPLGSVLVSHDTEAKLDINLTAFLLTETQRVRSDNDVIFYNQPDGDNGVIKFMPPSAENGRIVHRLNFDLTKIPSGIKKISVALTEDNKQSFATVRNLRAEVQATETLELTPGMLTTENGIIVLELYVHNSQPKTRSVWQGFASGLDGLCEHFGVEVTSAPTPPMVQKQAEPKPAPKAAPVAPATPSASTISLQKVTGKVSLDKNSKPVIIAKTPEIRASVSWKTGTDYDVYALVWTKDDKQVDVAAFGAAGVAVQMNFSNGAVEHTGDVGRDDGPMKDEIIKIRLKDNILAVVPVVYSAQSNGTGSFKRYKESMTIDNRQGTVVTIDSKFANNNDYIYTCVPGMILNTPDGVVIRPLELYSKESSENRPKLFKDSAGVIQIKMDAGPKNDYK
jgi:tellurite resistance protein TerA